MKKTLPFLLILATVLFPFVVSAQPAPAGWNTTITSAAGGTKTAFSISSFGNTSIGWAQFTTLDVTSWSVARSGTNGSPAGAWTMDFTNFTIPTVGVLTNLQSFESRIVDTIIFSTSNGAQYLRLGTSESALQVTNNQFWNLVLDPSVAEFEIDLAFDNFTPGTYTTTTPGPIYNMEIVPEPSTYALLALSAGGLGGYVLRRRRR